MAAVVSVHGVEYLQSLLALQDSAELIYANTDPATGDYYRRKVALDKLKWNVKELRRLLRFVKGASCECVDTWKTRLDSMEISEVSTSSGTGRVSANHEEGSTVQADDTQETLAPRREDVSRAEHIGDQSSSIEKLTNDTVTLLKPLTRPSNSTLVKLRMRWLPSAAKLTGDEEVIAKEHLTNLADDMKSTVLGYKNILQSDKHILEKSGAVQDDNLVSINTAKKSASEMLGSRVITRFFFELILLAGAILLVISTASFIFVTKPLS